MVQCFVKYCGSCSHYFFVSIGLPVPRFFGPNGLAAEPCLLFLLGSQYPVSPGPIVRLLILLYCQAQLQLQSQGASDCWAIMGVFHYASHLTMTFVQEDKYSYFCPRNFCYRNEEKKIENCWEQKKQIQIFFYYSWNVGSVLLMDFCTPSPWLIWYKTIFNKAGWAGEKSGPEKRGTGSPIETKNMVQQPNHRAQRNRVLGAQ